MSSAARTGRAVRARSPARSGTPKRHRDPADRYSRPMRRLWLQLAFMLVVLIDLSVLPAVVVGIRAGSLLSPGSHHSPAFSAIAFAVVLGVILIGATFAIGRAWRRAPRPGHPTSN